MADDRRAQDQRQRRILARIGALHKHGKDQSVDAEPPLETAGGELETLRERVDHLESELVGLQDSVHRENVRRQAEIQRLEKLAATDARSRSIEADADERGL